MTWHRSRKNKTHHATVTERGCIRLADGRVFSDPSPAAVALADHQTNGWNAWEADGVKLNDLKLR
ncbi:restriction system modified-DNA reader domain-containing protein [Actinoallomurus rhizosphaericola]|uniref:restriction system modified-DNA reader domain-containing protein n=1 Tax=Actinoallomurus rhizosphaericola TaxID=2952536 RepID=UPI0038738BF8